MTLLILFCMMSGLGGVLCGWQVGKLFVGNNLSVWDALIYIFGGLLMFAGIALSILYL